MDRFVSVVIPTHNRKNMIVNAINSVLNQTYPYLEVIVVDDASIDGTEELVKSIRDERLRYIKLKDNIGPSGARNVGIENSKYDYIAFEDSDDVWVPNKLEQQMSYFQDENVKMVYCAFSYQANGQTMCTPDLTCNENILSGNIFESLCISNKIGTPTIVAEKKCLLKIGGFSEQIYSLEDWELVLRFSKRYPIVFCNQILVHVSCSNFGVNHNVAAQVDALLYIMNEFSEMREKGNALNYLIQNIAELKDKSEIEKCKKKICKQGIVDGKSFDILIELQQNNRRLELYNKIFEKLCDKHFFFSFIKKYTLKEDGIAIYGMGYLGKSLFYLLRDNHINVSCIIDRVRVDVGDYQTIKMEDLPNRNISTIIVTVPMEFEIIKANIQKYLNVDCINIIEILNSC